MEDKTTKNKILTLDNLKTYHSNIKNLLANKIDASGDQTINGSLTTTGDFNILGNLNVKGNTSTVNQETLTVKDNFIAVNGTGETLNTVGGLTGIIAINGKESYSINNVKTNGLKIYEELIKPYLTVEYDMHDRKNIVKFYNQQHFDALGLRYPGYTSGAVWTNNSYYCKDQNYDITPLVFEYYQASDPDLMEDIVIYSACRIKATMIKDNEDNYIGCDYTFEWIDEGNFGTNSFNRTKEQAELLCKYAEENITLANFKVTRQAYAAPVYNSKTDSLQIGLGTYTLDDKGNIETFEFMSGHGQSLATRTYDLETGEIPIYNNADNTFKKSNVYAKHGIIEAEGLSAYNIVAMQQTNSNAMGILIEPSSITSANIDLNNDDNSKIKQFTLPLDEEADTAVLATREWVNENNVGSLEQGFGDSSIQQKTFTSIIEGEDDPKNPQANGFASIAFGGRRTDKADYETNDSYPTTRANGVYAFATGAGTLADGDLSFSGGKDTQAFGRSSVALGGGSIAGKTLDEYIIHNKYATSVDEITDELRETHRKAHQLYFTAAFAMGNVVKAKGDSSAAFGSTTQANGTYSFVANQRNIANGNASTAFGIDNTVNNAYGFAAGSGNIVNRMAGAAFGLYNVGGDTHLLEIGNGTSNTNRKNALAVRQDGRVILGADGIEDMHAVTKQQLDKATNNNLLLAINTSGIRQKSSPNESIGYGAVQFGNDTKATGDQSTSIGLRTIASGARSFAGGTDTVSSNYSSFAFGNNVRAQSHYSVAFGKDTVANGIASFVAGNHNVTNTDYTTAFGTYCTANGKACFAAGQYSNTNNKVAAFTLGSFVKAGDRGLYAGVANTGTYRNLFEIGCGNFKTLTKPSFENVKNLAATDEGADYYVAKSTGTTSYGGMVFNDPVPIKDITSQEELDNYGYYGKVVRKNIFEIHNGDKEQTVGGFTAYSDGKIEGNLTVTNAPTKDTHVVRQLELNNVKSELETKITEVTLKTISLDIEYEDGTTETLQVVVK